MRRNCPRIDTLLRSTIHFNQYKELHKKKSKLREIPKEQLDVFS